MPGSIFAHGVHLSAAQVERVEAAGCWLVQNLRSNRGNRVGYPNALRASRKVALGTDGYPAVMPDELVALREEAAAHDDALDDAVPRAERGRALVGERFGEAPRPDARPGTIAVALPTAPT